MPTPTPPRHGARLVLLVAATVLAAYAAWIGAYLAAGHEPRDFIKIGTGWVSHSSASTAIRLDPGYRYPPNHDRSSPGSGYDGQFAYYMALDPLRARHYIDAPAYRYTRVLYPALARGAALGHPAAVPAAMLAINWLAVGLGALALAAWLRRRRCSPWLALVFALYPGMLLAVQRDLAEPLAYALVAAAIWALDHPGRRWVLAGGALFALAALARETTLAFCACWAGAMLLSGRRADATRVALLGVLPLALYRVVLARWLGASGEPTSFFALTPFSSLAEGPWAWREQPPGLATVLAPALLFSWALARAARLRGWGVEMSAFALNAAVFVALAPPGQWFAWTAIGRTSMGVVLAAVLCAPRLRALGTAPRRAAWGAVALWSVLLPVVAVYGFSDVRV